MGVGVGKKNPENPRIGVRPSELGAWGYGMPIGLVQEAYFGSGSSYHAPQGYFWGYIRCPLGTACTGLGYTTVLWFEALGPSESVPWRPESIRPHAITHRIRACQNKLTL